MVSVDNVCVPIASDQIIVRNGGSHFKSSLNNMDLSWSASCGEEIARLCESFQSSVKLMGLVMSIMGSPLLLKITICFDLGCKKCMLIEMLKWSPQ